MRTANESNDRGRISASDDADCKRVERQGTDQRHKHVQQKAVDHGRHKGEQEAQPEPPQKDEKRDQQQRLETVLRHAEGEEGERRRNGPVEHIGRRDHHGDAEIRFLHEGHAESQDAEAENIR